MTERVCEGDEKANNLGTREQRTGEQGDFGNRGFLGIRDSEFRIIFNSLPIHGLAGEQGNKE